MFERICLFTRRIAMPGTNGLLRRRPAMPITHGLLRRRHTMPSTHGLLRRRPPMPSIPSSPINLAMVCRCAICACAASFEWTGLLWRRPGFWFGAAGFL